MSREGLNNFVYAAKHSYSLRKKLKECKEDPQNIINLATDYGFTITLKDLEEDQDAEKIEDWFKSSEISPLKNR